MLWKANQFARHALESKPTIKHIHINTLKHEHLNESEEIKRKREKKIKKNINDALQLLSSERCAMPNSAHTHRLCCKCLCPCPFSFLLALKHTYTQTHIHIHNTNTLFLSLNNTFLIRSLLTKIKEFGHLFYCAEKNQSLILDHKSIEQFIYYNLE